MNTGKEGGFATAIGSVPHEDPERAISMILDALPVAPHWPQMPMRGFREGMNLQYLEGFPCVVIDPEKEKAHFDTSGEYLTGVERFYEDYMAAEGGGSLDPFAVSDAFSTGIRRMEETLRARSLRFPFLKLQVTGPLTLGLSLTDESKRLVGYNEILADVLVKGVAMKARWMIERFRPFGDRMIVFFDEPILSGFGSSTFVSLSRDEVMAKMNELVGSIRTTGAIVGTHCCGNTDWGMLLETGLDMVNFDAYDYFEALSLYPSAIQDFFARGGILAWGIVPTSEKIDGAGVDDLERELHTRVDRLAAKGIDRDLVLSRMILTPSCGTGSMTVERSEKVYRTLAGLTERLWGNP